MIAQQTDFDIIAAKACPGIAEVDGTHWGIPDADCQQCKGTSYHFPWLWRECTFQHEADIIDRPCSKCGEMNCCPAGYILIEGEGERLLGLLRVAESLAWTTSAGSPCYADWIPPLRQGLSSGSAGI